ncbi:tape measure protein [Neorhizobium alkalisoli]|nr:tape measure protein [Neorhizobium alkalisoli]
MDKRLGQIGKSAAASLVAPLTGVAAALSVQEVMKYADAWTSAKNSLAVAGVTGRNQANVLDQLYQSAQRNATPIAALASLFGKAAQASDNLGASQDDLIKFSDGVAVALRVAGTSAPEASGALTQLGQLLGSARVQAEEFNSVNEGARPILMAVANGLDAAGGSVSKLKELVNDGKVSGQQFFQAFLKGLPSIESMAANSTQTIEQGFTKVQNALIRYVGSADSSLGASRQLALGLNALADNFDVVGDTVVTVAGVIAGVLVGRSISKLIGGLRDSAVAARAVVQALSLFKQVRSIGDLGAAFSLLGASAGPIAAIIGVAAVGAVTYFGGKAIDAAARTERLKQEMDALGINAERLGGKVDDVAKSLDKLAPDQLRQRLADINDELDRMNGRSIMNYLGLAGADTLGDVRAQINAAMRSGPNRNANDIGAAKQLKELVDQAEGGKLSLDQVRTRLDEIGKVDVSAGMRALIEKLREVFPQMRAIRELATRTKDSLSASTRSFTLPADYADRQAQAEVTRQQSEGQKILDEEKRVNQLTDSQKDLEDEMKRLREAISKVVGGAIASEAQIRQQAQENLDARAGNSAISGFVGRVAGAESGGNANAKNPSSSATGLGQFIESTWLNLFKKYFPDEAKGMSDPAILALRTNAERSKAMIEAYARENSDALKAAGISVTGAADEYKLQLAHFLGPQGAINVLKAAPGTLASSVLDKGAVAANPTILGGGRTVDDVIAYGQRRAGMTTAGTQRLDARDDFSKTLQDQQRYLERLKEETGIRQQLNPLVDDYGRKLSEFQMASELLTAAQEDGTEAGRELSSVQQLLTGDLSGLSPVAREQALAMRALAQGQGEATAAAGQLQAAQDRVKQSADEFKSDAKDVASGFISDLRNGVSAAEALSNALDKVVDKLIDASLNSLFGIGGGGGSGILSLFGLKNGGPIQKKAGGGRISGPGGPRDDKVLLWGSNGEFMVNAAATKKHRALLEAINSGAPALKDGGYVSNLSAPLMPTMRRTGSSSSGGTYAPTYHIDARGADQAAVSRLERGLQQRDRTESKRVAGRQHQQNTRKTRP